MSAHSYIYVTIFYFLNYLFHTKNFFQLLSMFLGVLGLRHPIIAMYLISKMIYLCILFNIATSRYSHIYIGLNRYHIGHHYCDECYRSCLREVTRHQNTNQLGFNELKR